MSSSSTNNDNEASPTTSGAATIDPETQYYLTIKTHTKISQVPQEEWNSLLRYEDSPFLKHEWLWCMEESGCAVPETGWNPCHLTIRMQKSKGGGTTKNNGGDEEGIPSDLEEEKGEIVAAAPCYIKTHSMGEFIFDNAWVSIYICVCVCIYLCLYIQCLVKLQSQTSLTPLFIHTHNHQADAAYRNQIDYYPKILVAVPFTPASGARLLLKDSLSRPVKDEIRKMVGQFLSDLAENNNFSSVHVNFCEPEEVSALQEAGV